MEYCFFWPPLERFAQWPYKYSEIRRISAFFAFIYANNRHFSVNSFRKEPAGGTLRCDSAFFAWIFSNSFLHFRGRIDYSLQRNEKEYLKKLALSLTKGLYQFI
jgi:hypothetical protein